MRKPRVTSPRSRTRPFMSGLDPMERVLFVILTTTGSACFLFLLYLGWVVWGR